MADLGLSFDATTVDPSSSFTVYPAGKYLCEIIQSEMRATKDGNGQFLWLELGILDGEHSGGKIFDRLNLVNANQTAQEIAQKALSAICHAVGVMQVSDSEQLHFKPLVVDLKVRPAGKDKSGVERDAQNEVKGYSAAAGQPATQQTAARPATPSTTVARPTTPAAAKPASAGAATPPWRR